MIALLEAHRAGLFTRQQLLPNLVAGVMVGVVAVPLAMAFAIAPGARPEQVIHARLLRDRLGKPRATTRQRSACVSPRFAHAGHAVVTYRQAAATGLSLAEARQAYYLAPPSRRRRAAAMPASENSVIRAAKSATYSGV
jgi:hypothetical protein